MRVSTLVFAILIGCAFARSKYEAPRRATVNFESEEVSGKLMLEQASINSPVKIRGVLIGLEPGRRGLHVHSGSSLGYKCEDVGDQYVPGERFEMPAGFLGNVKSFTGNPSRSDINLITSLVSLYEGNPRSILNRPIVIHTLPDDLARTRKLGSSTEDKLLACGLVRIADIESISGIEKEQPSWSTKIQKGSKIEQSILSGEKTWENVRHPFFGNAEEQSGNIESSGRINIEIKKLNIEETSPTSKVWMPGYTYEYDYSGWTSTSIMGLGSKATGGSIKGRLVIEPVDESTVHIALLDTKGKQFHEDIVEDLHVADPGADVNVIDQEDLEKPFTLQMVSGKIESVSIGKDEPLWVVNFKRGMAAQIQLQLDRTSGVFQKEEFEDYYAENTVYHTLEGCSSGDCELWYSISRLPEEAVEAMPKLLPVPEICKDLPVYLITKNRDFDNCRILPVFHYNSNQGLECNILNGAGCENKVSHVDAVKITGCTTREGNFIVQSIKSDDMLVVKPFSYETEAIEGYTTQVLKLRRAVPTGYSKLASDVDTEVDTYQTLSYSFDSENKIQGPLMSKPTLRDVNSPMVFGVESETAKREALRLLREIVSDIESESYYSDPTSKFIPDKINMVRRAFGYFDYPELSSLVSSVWENNELSTSNQVVLDALLSTGSNPSLTIVRELIQNGKISGESAVQAVASLPANVDTPTKELLSSWMDFLKSDVAARDQQLKITTALSLTRLVYQACVNKTLALNMYPKLVMGDFCDVSDSVVSGQLIPYLVDELKRAGDPGERIALLIALGNIGHEMIVPHVKPYITSCEPSTHYESEWYEQNKSNLFKLPKKEIRKKWFESKKSMYNPEEETKKMFPHLSTEDYEDEALCNIIRTKAIFALSKLATDKNQIVYSLLAPIAYNKVEETEVRLAALTLLFISNPVQAFWNRVALSTWYEPNTQVAHYIYTTIASKVLNKDPTYREVVTRAEAALPLMKPMYWASHGAVKYVKAGYVENSRLGYVAEVSNFPGFESYLPSHHYVSKYFNIGPWFTKLFEYAIETRHAEKFLDNLIGAPGLRFKTNKQESSIMSPELVRIHEELKIEARATGQPELFAYVNILDNYQRFYVINPHTVYETIQKRFMQKGFRENPSKYEMNYHKYFQVLDKFTRIPTAMGLAYTWISHHGVMISLKSNADSNMDFNNFNAKLSGSLKPVIVAKMTARMMTETPFTRSYPTTGVDIEGSIALPGTFTVEGDWKTGKLQTSWEFAGDKLRVSKYSVVPFTTIHKVTEFTPAILLGETKPVTYTDEVKENRYTFGEQTFGLNFLWNQKGDARALNQPWAYNDDWLGTLAFQGLPTTLRSLEQNLILDTTRSETKTIKTFLGFGTEKDTTSNVLVSGPLHSKSLFDTSYGQKIKSGQYLKTEDREWSWASHKFQNVFKGFTNPSGWSLDFTVELSPKTSAFQARRFGSSFAYGMDSETKQHRSSFMAQHLHEGENNFVFCADIETKQPETTLFKRKEYLRDETERTSVVKIGFGKSCTNDRKITITTELKREEEKVNPALRKKAEEALCRKHELGGRTMTEECLGMLRKTNVLNKAVYNIEYNEMPPVVTNATVKAINLFRYWMGAHMSDNVVDVKNPEGRITIESTYWPVAGMMDLKFYKPRSNTFYHGITLHPIAEIVMPQRTSIPSTIVAGHSICTISKEAVSTFDGVLYKASLGGCNKVLAKDCSGRYKFAVLGREEGGKKVLTVLLDNEKVDVYPGQSKAKVNGMDVSIAEQGYVLKNRENEILAVIKKTGDNYIEVDSSASHMLHVLSDGKEVIVLSSPVHRGRMCGLCGTLTGDKTTDLIGPRQCSIPRDLMDVAWELKTPAGCQSDVESNEYSELRRVQQECLREKGESVFGISNVSPLLPKFQQGIMSLKIERQPSEWITYRNKMTNLEDMRCFSTEPVVKCVEGSRIKGTEEKKLGFHCLPVNELSSKMYEDMNRRPLDELMGKRVDHVRVYTVPISCAPF